MLGSKGVYVFDTISPRTDSDISQLRGSQTLVEAENEIPTRRPRPVIWHWRWEISTFSLGTAAFLAIIALLLQFRDRPPQPLRLGGASVQLTAIIAALAQVAQSSLLVPISYCIGQLKWKWFRQSKQTIDLDRFDAASRGPEGSIRLLFHFSWRQRLVSIGAAATILMLVFSTFVQQSVQLDGKRFTELNSGLALLPTAQMVLMNSTNTSANWLLDDPLGFIRSYPQYSSAIMSGIIGYTRDSSISKDSDSYVKASCGGKTTETLAECRWANVHSLGVCVAVSDITNEIVFKGLGNSTINATSPNYDINSPFVDPDTPSSDPTGPYYNATSPQIAKSSPYSVSISAMKLRAPLSEFPPVSFQATSYIFNSSHSLNPPTSTSNTTNLANIAEVFYLYYDPCLDTSEELEDKNPIDNKRDPRPWIALKGQLQLCIQELEVYSSSDGFTSTKVVSAKSDIQWNNLGSDRSTSQYCTHMNSTGQEFCTSELAIAGISRVISHIFNTDASYNTVNISDLYHPTQFGPFLTQYILEANTTSSGLNCSFDSENRSGQGLFKVLKPIAQRLSDTFRQNGDSGIPYANGTYTYTKQVLHVDFRWFILPAILYAFVTIFFVATIVTTRDTPMWKMSPLPLLYATQEDGTLDSVNKLEKKIGRQQLRLTRAMPGWRLEKETEAPK